MRMRKSARTCNYNLESVYQNVQIGSKILYWYTSNNLLHDNTVCIIYSLPTLILAQAGLLPDISSYRPTSAPRLYTRNP